MRLPPDQAASGPAAEIAGMTPYAHRPLDEVGPGRTLQTSQAHFEAFWTLRAHNRS
jgi:hypothetical protein